MGKTRENDEVKHNTTNNLFASCSYCFYWLMDFNIYILPSGMGGLVRETKLAMQELKLKVQGGLCVRGDVIANSTVLYRILSNIGATKK